MLPFLAALAYPIVMLPVYLGWSRRQAEGQIDKMQAAVFNSPGAEAPIPPSVAVAGLGLLAGYGLVTMWLGVKGWQRVAALVVGAAVGGAIFAVRADRDAR